MDILPDWHVHYKKLVGGAHAHEKIAILVGTEAGNLHDMYTYDTHVMQIPSFCAYK